MWLTIQTGLTPHMIYKLWNIFSPDYGITWTEFLSQIMDSHPFDTFTVLGKNQTQYTVVTF